ncbi:hypothetical protein QYE76_029930 [Lolium multiflorum]|uniref:HSF-type DNA-binding domain-containing protein n=1 Tax=Lolium multiflorum TaxID=4521 RepID=A0AAD8VG09_LOLMU|nr:hypothetical protein QYE76_029930 [Lolium multiflorum]
MGNWGAALVAAAASSSAEGRRRAAHGKMGVCGVKRGGPGDARGRFRRSRMLEKGRRVGSRPQASSEQGDAPHRRGGGGVTRGFGGGCGGGGGPAPFLTKTHQMVEERGTDEVNSWAEQGRSFVVWKPVELARDLVPVVKSWIPNRAGIGAGRCVGSEQVSPIDGFPIDGFPIELVPVVKSWIP